MSATEKNWDWEIKKNGNPWPWNSAQLISYRHLLANLVKREFLLNYRQTILGPLWILFQPLLTLMVYVLVFGKIIGVPTEVDLPPVLFYLSGIVLWNFFNDSFLGTVNTFRDNIHVFSKVYFPRIIMPISTTVTHVLRLLIQLMLLIAMITYYVLFRNFNLSFQPWMIAFPFAILFVGMISLGLGLIFSVLTAKYRDIANFVNVGIRLLMFVTPVIYPMSAVHKNFRWLVNLNPLTSFFEIFRKSLLGAGSISVDQIVYGVIFAFLILILGLYLFNRLGNQLIDVV